MIRFFVPGVAKLERATAPASKNPSVGVYYRDGKPCKRKPKKDNLKKMSWSGGIAEWIENDTQQQINLFEGE